VPGMTCTVTGFHRPSRDGQQKVRFDTSTCFHAGYRCSHGDRKWLAVALNALIFVSELVSEVGRSAQPWVMRVGDFSVVETSRRASLVRVGTWSRRSVRGFGLLYPRG
jgi:hypothetical protein